jgi:threonine aldolase
MASRLARGVTGIDAIQLVMPQQTNAVFARIPPDWVAPLQALAEFYIWSTSDTTVRWMTSFDTSADDIDRFVEGVRALHAQ